MLATVTSASSFQIFLPVMVESSGIKLYNKAMNFDISNFSFFFVYKSDIELSYRVDMPLLVIYITHGIPTSLHGY